MKAYPFFLFVAFLFLSCETGTSKKQAQLYQTHCASCHLAPSIDHLTKDIWANQILPDMAARMGIKDSLFDPLRGLSFDEAKAVYATGIYPIKPTISKDDWQLLSDYIISLAPDSLPAIEYKYSAKNLIQFSAKPIALDSNMGSFITFLEYKAESNTLVHGDINGNLNKYSFDLNKNIATQKYESAIISHTEKKDASYTTAIGQLNPTEIPSGQVFKRANDSLQPLLTDLLHRPVHNLVADLNEDGIDEMVISEFGNLTGKLSLYIRADDQSFQKKILLNQPGTIRVIAKDMNADGKKDIIALTSQGDETITILYQQSELSFIAEKAIRFSPIYGSSWFELVDYDGDGDDDIITVHGDNADKSYIHKHYHGMRIHVNDGANNFEETYFYPIYGATRIIARDFDQDGDIDFGIISSFPNYDKYPELSFVYLENQNQQAYDFRPYTFDGSKDGRWFLMDAGDVDSDGDEDIILSTFDFVFSPVPEELTALWKERNIDIVVLENKLK